MITENEIIQAGKFLKPHGLKGELNAMVEFDPDILGEGYPLIVDIDGIYVPFYAESVRPKGHFSSLVKLEGVDSEVDARQFVNREFSMLRRDVAEFLDVPEDEIVTEDDFVGYKVFDREKGYIGTVEYIDSSTDNVLLHVRPEGADEEEDPDNMIYIPYDLVEEVVYPDDEEDGEDAAGELHVTLPEGLLDLNS